MAQKAVIERRFRGPPESANGGYACGVVAREIDGPADVSLHAPPPLDTALELRWSEESAVELRHGDALLASGSPAQAIDLDVPDPPSLEEAADARRDSPLQTRHFFPMCFVCGPDRKPPDGLDVISGPVEGRELVASPWEVTEDPAMTEDGSVREEVVWAVLDCPSGNAMVLVPDLEMGVLARLAGEINAPVEVGRTYLAMGWPIERDGRKLHTGAAILSEEGDVVARARALWIQPRDPSAFTRSSD